MTHAKTDSSMYDAPDYLWEEYDDEVKARYDREERAMAHADFLRDERKEREMMKGLKDE